MEYQSNNKWKNWVDMHLMIVNIGLGNGMVPSGTKPLPEPMLTQSYDAIWHH